MSKPGMGWRACLVLAASMLACGGPTTKTEAPQAAPAPDTPNTVSAAAVDPPKSESVQKAPEPAAPAPPQRPFANTPQEDTNYIDEAIETRHAEVEACVTAARERRKKPHVEISVELGIDQEGTLIGVKGAKGTPPDKVLFDCIRGALQGALFPRSKAGVITVKKTFSDQVIHR